MKTRAAVLRELGKPFEVSQLRALLNRFGSLRAMLDATYSDFEGLRGIGPAKKAQLIAIMEMARRSLVEALRINNPKWLGAPENG